MKLKKDRKKGDREKKGEALQNWDTPGQIGRVVMYDRHSKGGIKLEGKSYYCYKMGKFDKIRI